MANQQKEEKHENNKGTANHNHLIEGGNQYFSIDFFDFNLNANYAKFTQNPDLMAKLKATGDAIMAEASPQDKIWGIGMTADDPEARCPEHWNGQNLLGNILMEIRVIAEDTIKYYSRSLDDNSHLYKLDTETGKFYYMDHCWTGRGVWYERDGGFPPEFEIIEISKERARTISKDNLGEA